MSDFFYAYRSISHRELVTLLTSNNPIYGSKVWGKINPCECSCTLPFGTVCFWETPIFWRDKEHEIDIVCRFAEDKPESQHGTGTWNMPKSFAKTNIYTGREGSVITDLPEFYTRFYTVDDVESIHMRLRYSDHHRKQLRELAEKQGIWFYDN